MRNYIFYLSVALLAFGISSFVVFYLQFKYPEQSLIVEKFETARNTSKVKTEHEEIKYGCQDKEFKPFWEKLDKKTFLDFKRTELEKFNENYPEDFQNQWKKLNENFDCSYFEKIQLNEDVNNDGEKEVFVRGEITSNHGDTEMFVFQNRAGKFQIILYDIGSFEVETTEKKTRGYSEIIIKSNYTGGGRSINKYQFNGKVYKAKQCFSEDTWIEKKGYMIELDKPLVTHAECNQLSNLVK